MKIRSVAFTVKLLTNKRKDRQTGRQTDRHTNRQTPHKTIFLADVIVWMERMAGEVTLILCANLTVRTVLVRMRILLIRRACTRIALISAKAKLLKKMPYTVVSRNSPKIPRSGFRCRWLTKFIGNFLVQRSVKIFTKIRLVHCVSKKGPPVNSL